MGKLLLIKGFLWVRYDVFDNQDLNSSDMLVYMGLMRYMNNQTCTCFPSLTKLEEMTGLTRKTVYKSLAHLEEEGLVAISKEGGKVNQYLMLEPKQGKNSPSTRVNEQSALGEISPTNNTNLNNTKNSLCPNAEQVEIIAHLNKKLGLVKPKGFKDDNQQTLKLLNARLKDYTKSDVIAVIDVMCGKWLNTEWQMFLRPQTLFNVNKFESYVTYIDVEGAESRNHGVQPLQDLE